jgi:hypothetical protein
MRHLLSIAAMLCLVALPGASVGESCTLVIVGGTDELSHGGGLNRCGCHFNRTTGVCHCHQPRGCGCDCAAC